MVHQLSSLILPISLMLQPSVGSAIVGDCGNLNLKVEFEHQIEYAMTCEGYKRAKEFFNNYGFDVDTELNIIIRSKVIYHLDGKDFTVYGQFHSSTRLIEVSSRLSELVNAKDRSNFEIILNSDPRIPESLRKEYLDDLHISVIAHEIGHLFASHEASKYRDQPVGSGVSEFLAYALQIETLKNQSLKELILSQYEDANFPAPLSVNMMIHESNPHKFGVMSYRWFFSEQGGKNLFDNIIQGRFNPDLAFNF